jgi:hypothetical protein
MTKQTRRKFTPEFKAKVALEAAKDQLTLAQLSQKFEVNAVTISKWKSEFLANLPANLPIGATKLHIFSCRVDLLCNLYYRLSKQYAIALHYQKSFFKWVW